MHTGSNDGGWRNRRRRWRRIVGGRGNDRRSKTHAVAVSLETGRQRAPVLLTAHVVIRRSDTAAILRRVEACLAFSPELTFSPIRCQLLLSLAELWRDGQVLGKRRHWGGTSCRSSRGSLGKCRQRRCAQQQDQG